MTERRKELLSLISLPAGMVEDKAPWKSTRWFLMLGRLVDFFIFSIYRKFAFVFVFQLNQGIANASVFSARLLSTEIKIISSCNGFGQ